MLKTTYKHYSNRKGESKREIREIEAEENFINYIGDTWIQGRESGTLTPHLHWPLRIGTSQRPKGRFS